MNVNDLPFPVLQLGAKLVSFTRTLLNNPGRTDILANLSPDDRRYILPKSENGAGKFWHLPIHIRLYHYNGTKFGSLNT